MNSTNTNDGLLLKLAGASYSVYTGQRDHTSKKPLRFYDHCLNGFDGALASNCIEKFTGLIFDYSRPLLSYSVEPTDNIFLKAYTDYSLSSLVSEISKESIAELLTNASTLLTSRPEFLIIGTASIIILSAIIYQKKLKDSQTAQMIAAVCTSVATAKIANLFSPTLVYTTYLVLYFRRKSACFKKCTDPVFGNIEKKFASFFNPKIKDKKTTPAQLIVKEEESTIPETGNSNETNTHDSGKTQKDLSYKIINKFKKIKILQTTNK